MNDVKNSKGKDGSKRGMKWEFFNAAVDLFAAKGYANVSLNEIAEAVGKKAGNLNYYYRTKDELLAEIYEYYETKHGTSLFTLEEIIEIIKEKKDPYKAYEATCFYDLYLDPIAQKAMLIIIEERNRDSRADKIFANVFVGADQKYFREILNKLIELRIYEPFDVDSFVSLISGHNYFVACRFCGNHEVLADEWRKGHKLAFSIIKMVNP